MGSTDSVQRYMRHGGVGATLAALRPDGPGTCWATLLRRQSGVGRERTAVVLLAAGSAVLLSDLARLLTSTRVVGSACCEPVCLAGWRQGRMLYYFALARQRPVAGACRSTAAVADRTHPATFPVQQPQRRDLPDSPGTRGGPSRRWRSWRNSFVPSCATTGNWFPWLTEIALCRQYLEPRKAASWRATERGMGTGGLAARSRGSAAAGATAAGERCLSRHRTRRRPAARSASV
jgi:hypothetical protein